MKVYECDICHVKVDTLSNWKGEKPRSMYELKRIHNYDLDSYEGFIICQKMFSFSKGRCL